MTRSVAKIILFHFVYLKSHVELLQSYLNQYFQEIWYFSIFRNNCPQIILILRTVYLLLFLLTYLLTYFLTYLLHSAESFLRS